MRRRRLTLFALAPAVLLLAACGGGSSSPSPPLPRPRRRPLRRAPLRARQVPLPSPGTATASSTQVEGSSAPASSKNSPSCPTNRARRVALRFALGAAPKCEAQGRKPIRPDADPRPGAAAADRLRLDPGSARQAPGAGREAGEMPEPDDRRLPRREGGRARQRERRIARKDPRRRGRRVRAMNRRRGRRAADAAAGGDRPHPRRAGAPLELVMFGDFQCPFCLGAQSVLRRVHERLGDRLLFAFRHLPIPERHPLAPLAAEAERGGRRPGQVLGVPRRPLRRTSRNSRARRCSGRPRPRPRRRADGGRDRLRRPPRRGSSATSPRPQASGATGTPSFFVNGKRHFGAYDAGSLVEALEAGAGSAR